MTVTIPAGESVTVTARAEGLNEGDMVTFTVDGEAQDASGSRCRWLLDSPLN